MDLTFNTIVLSIYVFMVITHIVPHAIDLGINKIQTASILSLIGGFIILGRILVGRVSDSIGMEQTIMLCSLLMVGAFLWLIWSSNLWILYVFSTVFGFAFGGIAPPLNALTADIFGMRNIGIIMAAINSSWGIGAAIGPVLAGYIFDISGSYLFAFLTVMVAALITVILTLFIRAPNTRAPSQLA
ncbi:MFS transporter [Chloroflexota bacterium]